MPPTGTGAALPQLPIIGNACGLPQANSGCIAKCQRLESPHLAGLWPALHGSRPTNSLP